MTLKKRHLALTWTYIKAHFTVIYALIKIYKTCNPWDSRYFIWEQISIENVFHQHSRQSTKKTNSIPFFLPQFQLGNHTGYCIEKMLLHLILDFICIGKTPHTHTHKVLKLYLTLTRKINATYWRSFFNNHFLRAVTSMATNILAFLSSSKSSQASKKISSSMLGMVWSAATLQYIEL